MESTEFGDKHRIIIDLFKAGGNEYPDGVSAYLLDVLRTVDFVAMLIELDYLDQDLLLYLFANDLMELDTAITNFDQRDNSRITGIRASFPRGFALLKEASKASSEGLDEWWERVAREEETKAYF